jgi:hypothetical protein
MYETVKMATLADMLWRKKSRKKIPVKMGTFTVKQITKYFVES